MQERYTAVLTVYVRWRTKLAASRMCRASAENLTMLYALNLSSNRTIRATLVITALFPTFAGRSAKSIMLGEMDRDHAHDAGIRPA
jgi:hypothetical protein